MTFIVEKSCCKRNWCKSTFSIKYSWMMYSEYVVPQWVQIKKWRNSEIFIVLQCRDREIFHIDILWFFFHSLNLCTGCILKTFWNLRKKRILMRRAGLWRVLILIPQTSYRYVRVSVCIFLEQLQSTVHNGLKSILEHIFMYRQSSACAVFWDWKNNRISRKPCC